MRKRIIFNIQEAIPAAWDFLWADNLKRRAKGDAFRNSETYFLTASDVENQVRQFAIETFEGKPRGSYGRAYDRPVTTVRFCGNLNGAVRDWLLRNSAIEGHNFGRGHISGRRFRPAGEPISPTEAKTMKVKEARKGRPALRHWFLKGGPACTAERRAKRSFHGRGSRNIWIERKDQSKVTCARCAKVAGFKAEAA